MTQAHSHQVTPEDGNTPDPSTHLVPSPHSPPPHSHRRAHVSFQDMLRQQLGQQVGSCFGLLMLSCWSSSFDMRHAVSGPSNILLFYCQLFEFVLMLYITCTFKLIVCGCQMSNLMIVVCISRYAFVCRSETRILACIKRQRYRMYEAFIKRC